MNESNSTAQQQSVASGFIGALLVQFIVPAWIFIGAFTKAQSATPKLLPRSILDAGDILGMGDHYLLLLLLIGIEFLFIGVMLFIPRYSRRAALAILGVFLAVLSVEMFGYGNYESCGCLGNYSPAPYIMFAIDFFLLLGIITCKPTLKTHLLNKGNRGFIGIALFCIGLWGYSINNVMSIKGFSADSTLKLPDSWYPSNLSDWAGKSIDEIELFSWITWPQDIHIGQQYIIFYGKTCDHCEALLYMHFEFDLSVPTTLVAIPESKKGFLENDGFENPCFDCIETELPIGVDWIIGTPMVVAIQDGVVHCVIEGEESENPACLIW